MFQRTVVVVCAMLISLGALWAQDGQGRAQAVMPWVTEDTVLIVAARIEDVDLDVLGKWITNAAEQFADPAEVPQAKQATAGAIMFARGLVGELKAAGVKDMYAILDAAPHRREQVIVVLPAGQNAQLVADKLKALVGRQPAVSVDQNAAIMQVEGRPAERAPRAERPELASALNTDAPVVMALSIPQASRDEIPAELPRRMGGGDPAPIRDGFMWARVELRIAPEPSLHGVGQMDSDENAKGTVDLVRSALDAMAERGGDGPLLVAASKWLMPSAKGDQIVIDLPTDSIREAIAELGPTIQKSRMKARQIQSASQIRQMLQGVLLFANENNGKTPDKLEETQPNMPWLMKNPQHPEQVPGYVYVRQPLDAPNPSETIMIYEAYTKWPGGINVGYVDGHVEWTIDEAEFLRRLKASGGK